MDLPPAPRPVTRSAVASEDGIRCGFVGSLCGGDGDQWRKVRAACVNGAAAPPTTADKLDYLRAALASATGDEVICMQTHMSWVLLGREHALKLKKPVRWAFLDFSTVQARERYAREELRLNRRLAPGVYRGLRALQWQGGGFALVSEEQLPAPGTTVDWLVCMRRLPADRMLDQVITHGALRPAELDALVGVLVGFYRQAVPTCVSEDDYLRRLHDELQRNRRLLELPRFALPGIRSLLGRMDGALARHEQALRARVREQHIVDGHGDLRPEHVCLLDPPVVIDALEFDAHLREVDPLDELCFLSLECMMLGDASIGRQILAGCAAALLDQAPAQVIALYTAKRALLRARLSVAHLLDADVRSPAKWLPQAQRYLQQAGAALDLS